MKTARTDSVSAVLCPRRMLYSCPVLCHDAINASGSTLHNSGLWCHRVHL